MAERPLFDPALIRPVPPTLPSAPVTYTVRQVNELIRGALVERLPATIHVVGEIADLSRPSSGHVYFTLKDHTSELPCVMWRSVAAKVRFELKPGLEVIATGKVDVYIPRGVYQLYISRLEPRGIGALELAFRQLRERLEREGLFDPARKKPLPRIPQRVGLVTSPTGAAIRDILQTLRRRFLPLEIVLFPVRVQGEGAAEEIAAAIRLMNAVAERLGGIDVAIVGRGGGSLEDLWAFNEEIVARAIAESRIPIVSAVGHEIDVSISDLVADARAATPTAAAQLIVPQASELLKWLSQSQQRACRALRHRLELAQARLDALLASDVLSRPLALLQPHAQMLDELVQRLRLSVVERFRKERQRLDRAEMAILRFRSGVYFRRLSERLAAQMGRLGRALSRAALRAERTLAERLSHLQRASPRMHLARLDEHLDQVCLRLDSAVRSTLCQCRRQLEARLQALAAYNPANVLQRGYSITREAHSRRILRSVEQIREGLLICTQLADGEFRSVAQDPRQARLFE
jgi:exodeoxyribonuclease VII large subunit